MRKRDDRVDVVRAGGLVDAPSAARVLRDDVRGVAGELGVVGEGEALLDDRGVQAQRRGDHADVGLREGEHGDAFAFELLRGLAEPPRVKDDLAEAVAVGELADLLDAFEDAAVSVIDRAPTWSSALIQTTALTRSVRRRRRHRPRAARRR